MINDIKLLKNSPHCPPKTAQNAGLLHRIHDYFFGETTRLRAETGSLLRRVATNPNYELEEKEKNTIKQAINNCQKIFNDDLKKTFVNLNFKEVQEIFCELITEDEKFIDKSFEFLKLFDEKQLESLAAIDIEQEMQIEQSIKDLALQSTLQAKRTAIFKEAISEIVKLFHYVMEVLIAFSGLSDIESKRGNIAPWKKNDSMSQWEAKAQAELWINLIGFPSIIFASLYTILGAAIPASLFTGLIIVSTLLFIALYMRYLRPCPHQLNGKESLTVRYLRQQEEPVFWRKDIMKKIISAFESGKGALLVGDTGCGKTSIVHSLAELMLSPECPKFLKGNQLFDIRSSINIHGENFQGLEYVFKNYTKEVVFFLDEVQTVFKENGILGNQVDNLKAFCNKFPYIIAATTTNEFEEIIEKEKAVQAVYRRFEKIHVPRLGEQDLESSLYEYLQRTAPKLLLGKGVISHIRENAHKFHSRTSNVDASHSLLKKAVADLQNSSFPLEEEISGLEQQLVNLKYKLYYGERNICEENGKVTSIYHEIKKLNKEIEKKKEELENKQKRLEQIKKIEALYLKVKKESYIYVSKGKRKEWIRSFLYKKILASHIKREKTSLGLPAKLNRSLINKIIKKKSSNSKGKLKISDCF